MGVLLFTVVGNPVDCNLPLPTLLLSGVVGPLLHQDLANHSRLSVRCSVALGCDLMPASRRGEPQKDLTRGRV